VCVCNVYTRKPLGGWVRVVPSRIHAKKGQTSRASFGAYDGGGVVFESGEGASIYDVGRVEHTTSCGAGRRGFITLKSRGRRARYSVFIVRDASFEGTLRRV